MSEKNSKLLEFFRKIGRAILNPKEIPDKIRGPEESSAPKEESKKEIPSFLKGFFERRAAGWQEYMMLKVQIAVILLFVTSVILSFSWISHLLLAPIIIVLIGYLIYLTPKQLKPAFERDYPAYRAFVGLSIVVSLTFISLRRFLKVGSALSLPSFYQNILPVILVVGIVFFAFVAFRAKYGRNYTYGIVEDVKRGKAKVKVNYDIKSNVKSGLHLLDSLSEVSVGDEVKVGVDRSLLGLRGSEPTSVLEKVD